MKKVFSISGGAGRVLCSIPALEKYYKKHGNNFYIYSESGMEFFAGNKKLQDLTYTPDTKDVFEHIIRPNNLITPEPYREHGYYNQKRSLAGKDIRYCSEGCACSREKRFGIQAGNYFFGFSKTSNKN